MRVNDIKTKMKECPWYGSTLDLMLPYIDYSNKKIEDLYPASSYAWAIRELKKCSKED